MDVKKMLTKRKKWGRAGRNRRLHWIRAARDHLQKREETWMERIKKWQEEDENLSTMKKWNQRPPWEDVAMGGIAMGGRRHGIPGPQEFVGQVAPH